MNKSVSRYVPTDLTTPNIVGPTMLGVVASVLTVVWKLMQQLPTKCNYMQQGVQTDGKSNIKQCWELLANNVASICTGLKVCRLIKLSLCTDVPPPQKKIGRGDGCTEDVYQSDNVLVFFSLCKSNVMPGL